ncbi:MAG: hypothetical protein PHP95_04090 [Desulfuromonadaceae bacterium]|nr:hypothetical protein [Desulfuromonadaceae bacterium]MDD2847616.1 hypothetical protein [Desulfuromonadaceae bacterium]MDD4131138.1 hypothetical protein [Desulfuromonadaceae bacterium]
MSYPIDPAELTKEKFLYDIYKTTHIFERSKFNSISIGLVFLSLVAYSLITNEDYSAIANKTRVLADLGISLIANLLGFLIAGFTIFATFGDKDFFMFLAVKRHAKYGISYLKYSFFTFMKVFIVYSFFGAICICIKLFCDKGGLISILFESEILNGFLTKKTASCVSYTLIGTYMFYLFIVMKSFIFNVYHVVMTKIRWEFERADLISEDQQSELPE